MDGRIAFRFIPEADGVMEGFLEDITERKLAEDMLRDNERFLSQTEKIAHIGGWKVNPLTDSLVWTQGVYNIHRSPS